MSSALCLRSYLLSCCCPLPTASPALCLPSYASLPYLLCLPAPSGGHVDWSQAAGSKQPGRYLRLCLDHRWREGWDLALGVLPAAWPGVNVEGYPIKGRLVAGSGGMGSWQLGTIKEKHRRGSRKSAVALPVCC